METINQAPHNNEEQPKSPDEVRRKAAKEIFDSLLKTKSFGGDPYKYVNNGEFKVNTTALAVAATAQSYTDAARMVHTRLTNSYQ